MRLRKDEVACVRLALGSNPNVLTRACVTADNQWRIHAEDSPNAEWQSVWQDILHSMAALEDKLNHRYTPVPKLRYALAAVRAWPGSELANWRGQRAYERQLRANAALPAHKRMIY